MSEFAEPGVAAQESAGAMLRRAREAAGLHVASLAVALKVPVRKLEALEEDRHDQLPDAVFVRALASSVCRTLKIDPQPVLDRLPQTAKPRLAHTQDGINAPFRPPGEGPLPALRQQLGRPVVVIVSALLLAALVLVFWPVVQPPADSTGVVALSPAMPPGTPETVTAVPAEPRPPGPAVAIAPPAAAADAANPAAGPAAAPARPSPSAPAPALALAPAPAPAMATPPQAPAAAAASGIVVFRARAASWIQVTDARGTQVLRKLMEPGETAGANGVLPLSVTVGSAEATEVEVRGKPFDLAPVSRDNVARFEVK